ncbi:MAG: LytTR family DNA-binding domain-containing protein [Syntrophales bacterium]|nr:LytTR family DNA-binding domain-containing protein [Syntrophales bacterium]MDD5640195.1 LytTR family DNA-binding domain-containing protein [Syntrophales bacterium]
MPTDTGRLKTLIVDDERLARENLRGLLAAHEEIEVVGEARNAAEARLLIAEKSPDLVLLDIQMPGGTGFDLLEQLEFPPPIIFVTAFDNFAIRAFEVNALDYLLKPVEPERLARALERVGKRDPEAHGTASRLRGTDRVFLDTGRQAIFLAVAEIAAIRAEGNYTQVITGKGLNYLVRIPLHKWETRLPAEGFVLLDRSLLINRSQIRGYVLQTRRAEIYLGGIAKPFLLGRKGLRRFKEKVLPHLTGTIFS